MKPKLTIDNFTGMGDNGLFWCEGYTAKKTNGQSVMTPSGFTYNFINTSTTGFTNLGGIQAMDALSFDGSNDYIIGYDNTRIFIWHYALASSAIGEIHNSSSVLLSNEPDILVGTKGDILYTTRDYMGMGLYGTCHSSSSTTKIVDSDGRDFTTLGLGTTSGINKVYNMNNKEEYTITSITNENATNDCLNFSAGTANSTGDEFYAFVDNKFHFFDTASNDQFKGQPALTAWHRQIKLFGNYYYALNGNYLAQLSIDNTTWTSDVLEDDYKQLLPNIQGTCMDVNTDKLLVGGSYKNSGKLLLWDGYSDGWLNEIGLDDFPSCIKAYKTGWIVLVGNTIYFTNGYQLQKISSYPIETGSRGDLTTNHNGLTVMQDKILISCDSIDYNRRREGVFIYEPESGWNYLSMADTNYDYGYEGESNGIFSYSKESYAFVGQKIRGGSDNINRVQLTDGTRSSFVYYVKLPEKMKISGVELNISPTTAEGQPLEGNTDITINYGDGKQSLIKSTGISSSSTTTLLYNVSGASYSGILGGKVLILSEDASGDITYITDITNAGTNNEELTVSPALSTDITNSQNILIMNLKKTRTVTVSNTDIPNELNFNINNFYSDKLFIEVVAEGSYPLDIHSINVY